MRRAIVTVLLAAALSACGGNSSTQDPLSACKTGSDVVCNKSFQCYPTEAQNLYGTVSNCITAAEAANCTTAKLTCPAGTTFNSDNASKCIDGYRNESCTDLLNANVPPACLQTCT